MKLSIRVLLLLLTCAGSVESVLRLAPKTASGHEGITLHPAMHSGRGSTFENTSVVDASQGRASSTQEEIASIGQELDGLRESRFFSHPGSTNGAVQTVWIVGLGRSGTTLLQNLIVSAAVGQGVSVFASFEPCHAKDDFKDKAIGHRRWFAAKCMEQALRCNFSSLEKKVHINKTTHQVGVETLPIHPDGVSDICAMSRVRVFKTIYPVPTWFGLIQKWIDLPDNVQIVEISRDPRSIFSSVLGNDYFSKMLTTYTPPKICQTELHWVPEWQNQTLKGQLLPIKFESLVLQHSYEERRILNYFGWHESAQLDHFINTHMSATDCTGHNKDYGYNYGTCRTVKDTLDVITKWKRNLAPAQKAEFTKPLCARAIPKFGYMSKFWGQLYD